MNRISKLKTFTFLLLFTTSILAQEIMPGAYSTQLYIPALQNKRIALVANQTSTIGSIHLVDSLLSNNINIVRIFCPEHGFRGNIGAGEKVNNQTDKKTGIKLVSLYGKHYKPKASELQDIDIVVFDIQDVGVRFYTYISTLHYVMEACAENNISIILLDRPNPNGFYIDGPVLEPSCKSFVGIHPIPIVYGLTIGELATMINGEGWLKNGVQCSLKVIECQNYTHQSRYQLPIKPSPNLPNMQAVYLYPSLALFEGTNISVGRGTEYPFQTFGHPNLDNTNFNFCPIKLPIAPDPPFKNIICKGIDLRNFTFKTINSYFSIEWLLFAYKNIPDNTSYFNNFFRNLVGNEKLKQQIEQNIPIDTIIKTWTASLDSFYIKRKNYLIYK